MKPYLRNTAAFCLVLFALLALLSSLAAKSGNGDFTIVVLPDTQKYTLYHPEIFPAQTQWIHDNVERENIRFVLHLGDITNDNTDGEWAIADQAMGKLDDAVPYAVVPGNHDMWKDPATGKRVRQTSKYNLNFPPERFSGQPWYGGHKDDLNDNNYSFLAAGRQIFMLLGLEFGPEKATLEWANELLAAHRDKKVIVFTHCYMYRDDTRVGPGDDSSPHKQSPDFSDGEQMWERFVRRHPNIFLVISGHIKGDGAGRLTSIGDHGNKVHQMLINFQMIEKGGNGWLRLLRFDPDEDRIFVTDYSPTLGKYHQDPEHRFALDVDFDF